MEFELYDIPDIITFPERQHLFRLVYFVFSDYEDKIIFHDIQVYDTIPLFHLSWLSPPRGIYPCIYTLYPHMRISNACSL